MCVKRQRKKSRQRDGYRKSQLKSIEPSEIGAGDLSNEANFDNLETFTESFSMFSTMSPLMTILVFSAVAFGILLLMRK